MTDSTFYPLIQDTMTALAPHYTRATSPVFRDVGFAGADWFLAYVAHSQAPEPLALANYHAHFPFASSDRQRAQFQEAVDRGFFTAVADDTYRLTAAGQTGIQRFFNAAQTALAAVTPLPAPDLTRLVALLSQVIAATEANAPATYQMAISRATDPGTAAAPLARIDQFITDLARYRDDAHEAAWRDLGVSGPAWEALTAIWQDQAHTADELAAQLPQRGHDAPGYAAALQELAAQGWVMADDGRFSLTAAGQQVRDRAESDTEAHYTIGLSALSPAETAELKELLTRLNEALIDLTAVENTAVFSDTWATLYAISGHLYQLTRPVINPLLAEADVAARGEAHGLLNALAAAPEPISARVLSRRNPFTAADRLAAPLAALADKGYLAAVDDGAYQLTADGRGLAEEFIAQFRRCLGDLETRLPDLAAADLDRLAETLERLSAACRRAGDPPGVVNISHSHKLAPEGEAAALARIDQAIDDLNAFRDDAHLASFKPHKMTGHTWDLFTALWREEVTNPADMAEQRAHRGHDVAAYQMALLDLLKRGWVAEATDGGYAVTAVGRQIRQEAERLTDAYFYLPWSAVAGRTEELQAQTTQLAAALQQLTEAEAVPA